MRPAVANRVSIKRLIWPMPIPKSRGQTENVKAVENAHRQRRQGNKKQIRKDDAVEINGLSASGIFAGKQLNNRGREDHPQNGDDSDDERKGPKQAVREVPNLFLGLLPHVRGEDGDEGGGHGAFGDEAAEQIGYTISKNKGVGSKGSTQQESDALVADVAENAADNRDQGDDRSRFEDALFIGQRAVLRGPNPNENNELTGKACLT